MSPFETHLTFYGPARAGERPRLSLKATVFFVWRTKKGPDSETGTLGLHLDIINVINSKVKSNGNIIKCTPT